jgi:hypothetical protein
MCTAAQAHVVSLSNGELRVTGQTATLELRIPTYEIEHTANPETALLDEIRFTGATRSGSECTKDADWFTCHASYTFAEPVPDRIEVDCTLYRVTVPNHIHMLYAAQGPNSDQRVFDQNQPQGELRFHPPSMWESLSRDGRAGALRLLQSVAGLLFLGALALSARSWREGLLLTAAFVAAQWLARPISPYIPIALSPDFLESVMALTVAYLAGELLFLPGGHARWIIVPLLGWIHGFPYVAYPAFYLVGANLLQLVLIVVALLAALRLPTSWRRPAVALLLIGAGLWFARLVFA